MTANRCLMTDSRLNDYFDRLLSQEEALETARHVENCEECREALMDLAALAAEVRDMPESIAPERDLWPELAERLVSRGAFIRRLFPNVLRVAMVAGAAAAVLILCVVSTFRETMSSQGMNNVRPSAGTMQTEIVSAEEAYVDATNSLFYELEMYRHTMSPETVETVKKNLYVTGSAIRDIRIALENDPGNADLSRRLMEIHSKQVKLLQQVVESAFAGRDREAVTI